MPLDDWQTTPRIPDATVGPVTGADRLRPVPLTPGRMPTGDTWLSDAELIARSVGDPECFAEVFDRHGGEILRYVHSRLGLDLAEDVTAETFLAAFRSRDRYDTTRPDARPWLYGIAVRQIASNRRAEARYRRLLASAPLETGDGGLQRPGCRTSQRARPPAAAGRRP